MILSDFREQGRAVFSGFNPEAGVEGTLGYYRGLIDAFRARSQHLKDERLPRLLAELDRTVSTLEHELDVVGVWP
jgi:hypothetical protein